MPRPLISVLIPMYNAETGIKKTLESIQQQTLKDFEIIVVNDGSTDRSAEIVTSVCPEACIISQDNSGIAKALNVGLKYCRGQYIARIDCNDTAYSQRFAWQAQILLENLEVGAVGGHIMLYEKDGMDLGVCQFPTNPEAAEQEVLLGNAPISHTGAMIRKQILTEVGGYDPFFNGREDIELWCRISLVSKLTNVDRVVMRVLSTPEGLSYSGVYLYPLINLALIERVERLEKGLEWKNEDLRFECQRRIRDLKSKEFTQSGRRRQKSLFYVKRAGFLLRSGQRSTARREYKNAVLSDPIYLKGWLGIFSSLLIPTSLHLLLVRFLKALRCPRQ